MSGEGEELIQSWLHDLENSLSLENLECPEDGRGEVARL